LHDGGGDSGKKTASLDPGIRNKEGCCHIDLALGDTDGDGKAEVIVAASPGTGGFSTSPGGASAWLLENSVHGRC